MTTAATISARLILDSKDFDEGTDRAKKKATDFQTKMSNMGASMMKVGGAMTLGLTVPIAMAGKTMVDAAADYEEAGGAVETVFGDMSGAIDDFSEKSAEMAGLSAADFKQMGAVGGALLKNLGFDASEAADEMVDLTKRAADLGATFNADTSQALNAVQSALKGEFNPLEQFGVKMNAADISARAMAMGLADANGELDNAAKAQAALAIFYEQTADVQGAFARESEGVTGSMKVLKAQMTDQARVLGQMLLPYVIQFLGFISDLMTKFQALSPETQKFIMIALGIVAVLGPAITIVGGLVTAISAIIPVITAIAGVISLPILALVAAIALLVFLWTKYGEKIKATVKQIGFIIKHYFDKFKKDFTSTWTKFVKNISETWTNYWNGIKNRFAEIKVAIIKKLVDMIRGVIDFFSDIDWKNIGKNIVVGIVNGIASLAVWAWGQMQEFAEGMADIFRNVFDMNSPSGLMMDFGKNIVAGLTIGLEPVGGTFSGTGGKNTTINMTLPSGVITKNIMRDVLDVNNAEFSNSLAEAISL